MRINEVKDDDIDLVPSSLRLKEVTKKDLEELKEKHGKKKVTKWLRGLVEEAVESEKQNPSGS
jgi:hypothetical protein